MLRIDGARELQAAALLYRRAPDAIRKSVRAEAAAWAPTLVAAANRGARTPVDRQVAASGRTKVSTYGLVAVFGSGGRLSSGAPLREVAGAQEFGSGRRESKKRYLSRRGGRAVQVDRRTKKQVPAAVESGRFIYPAVADATPDLVARWVRAIAQAVTYGR